MKSIEKTLEEKKNVAAKYRDALTKMTEVEAASKLIVDLAAANKRAESEVIRLEAILAEAKLAAKNKSEVSLGQRRHDAIQKIKDGSFDFLASYGLVRAEDRAELDKAIDDVVKEITNMATFVNDMGLDLSKKMSASTKEKRQANSRKIDSELAGLNSLFDELMKSGLK